MALDLEKIRAAAERVAHSHGLEVVEVDFSGGAKNRNLRVLIEKDAEGRKQIASGADLPERLASGALNADQLSGITHEDCEVFSRDFGTLLDVDDLIPGEAYTLEISSPGLDRRLVRPEDFVRFQGSLLKVQTSAAINGNRHWQGRLVSAGGEKIALDLSAVKQKGKARKAGVETVEIALSNIDKANLVPEI